jgi:colicin import membrane protein
MVRKLKTYQTSLGFFDLAIAAPSMKAALEAWDSKANLFHQCFAKETDDPAVIAATMAKPGIVLRRAVGSNGSFSEHAKLPKHLTSGEVNATPAKRARKSQVTPPPRMVEDKAAREAAVAFATDRKRRDLERRRQEAAQESERKRREQAIAKAAAALSEGERTHESRTEEIAAERSGLDQRSEAEATRWNKARAKLQAALRRARE